MAAKISNLAQFHLTTWLTFLITKKEAQCIAPLHNITDKTEAETVSILYPIG
jgi:hypothetical protein